LSFSLLGSSLLSSALALLTLAAFFHLATCEHTAVMGLQELSSLMQRLGFLPVFSLLLLDDCVEGLTSALLFNALSPLFLDLRQMLLLL